MLAPPSPILKTFLTRYENWQIKSLLTTSPTICISLAAWPCFSLIILQLSIHYPICCTTWSSCMKCWSMYGLVVQQNLGWLVGLVEGNIWSFDFVGAWPNVVQHFWQWMDILYNYTTNISCRFTTAARDSSLCEKQIFEKWLFKV